MSAVSPWKVVPLQNIAEQIDYGLTASATDSGNGPKFLRITDIQEDRVDWSTVPFCNCTEEDSKKYALMEGDIVFARTGATTGKSFLVRSCPQGSVFASYLIRVRPSAKVVPSYLARFFQTPNYWNQINRSATGTAQAGVNASNLKKLAVPLPPLEEQRRIAAILDKADAVRRKRKEAIALTEELLRSAFLDMFGDPVTNPKGWALSKLSDVCDKITDGTHHSPPTLNKGIPYITAKHLKVYGLDFFSDPWFVSEEDHKKIYTRCNPEQGDVLYIKDGVTTGIAAINNYDFEFSMLSSLALLKVGKAIISEYLCDWLNNESVRTSHLKNVAGAAITRLTLTKIKDFYIPVPPLTLQIEYKIIRQKISKMMVNIRKEETEYSHLFNSLLQKAFRGEL
ncbi:restriction endonuclease subunit S [Anabaena sp. CA = ATCC 33047]|uniref:restriction endonuclease subunit S n=1 Tax=Anabaena sp. (strain CA / ATCC 33047) TaxID=52271 RepID=UPI000835B598|nr:restriction endonuclease subunit S [Anabaena sp. CA = ATCC 33047]